MGMTPQQVRDHAAMVRWGRALPGLGPWRILADCPATGHNTYRAARDLKPMCVCPRAAAIREEENEKRRQRYALDEKGRPRPPLIDRNNKLPGYFTNVAVPQRDWPDFRRGLCRTARGALIVDAYLNRNASAPLKKRVTEDHQEMCLQCPLMIKCAEWIMKAEKTAGSWGGIYGGLTPLQREKAARKRRAEAAARETTRRVQKVRKSSKTEREQERAS